MRYPASILLILNLGQEYANLLLQDGPGQMDVESSRSETENKFYAGLLRKLGENFSFQAPQFP